MKALADSTGGAPVQVKSHPIRFGSGDWTCVVGELEDGTRDGDPGEVAQRRHRRGVHLDLVVLAAPAGHNSTYNASSRADPWSLGTKVRWGVTWPAEDPRCRTTCRPA